MKNKKWLCIGWDSFSALEKPMATAVIEVLKTLSKDMYVDDVVSSVRTVEEGFWFYSIAKGCFMNVDLSFVTAT